MNFNPTPRTMDRRISVCLFLLVVWFSTGGFLMVVSTEPTVTAWIVTPEADRKEGGRVEMRCVATKLNSSHIVEWRVENPRQTLIWNATPIRLPSCFGDRYKFNITQSGSGEIIQKVYISDLQKNDTTEYGCNVNQPKESGGNIIVATEKVHLSVFYFPNEPFPICSPEGPTTADTGTQLNMSCFSQAGNSAVMMRVSQLPISLNPNMYTWRPNINNDTLLASSDLTVGIDDHNVMFQCIINSTYFPDLNRSCTIGPIKVMRNPSEPMIQTTLSSTTKTTTGSPTAIIAGASAGGVTALILFVILIIICRRRGLCDSQPKPPAPHTQQTSDPPDDTVFTTDQTVHSQPNIYQESRQETQDKPPNTGVNIYYDPSEISLTASPSPELSWQSGTTPVTRGVQGSATPLYATPHRETTTSSGHDAREGKSHHSTKQTYINPVFDSQESNPIPGPSEDPPRPTAMVPPMQGVPIKPKPFKPKPQRVSSSQYGTLNEQDHQRSSEVHGAPPSPPQQVTSSTNSGPVYASVMKNRAKNN